MLKNRKEKEIQKGRYDFRSVGKDYENLTCEAVR